jgi:hypothetical protein
LKRAITHFVRGVCFFYYTITNHFATCIIFSGTHLKAPASVFLYKYRAIASSSSRPLPAMQGRSALPRYQVSFTHSLRRSYGPKQLLFSLGLALKQTAVHWVHSEPEFTQGSVKHCLVARTHSAIVGPEHSAPHHNVGLYSAISTGVQTVTIRCEELFECHQLEESIEL